MYSTAYLLLTAILSHFRLHQTTNTSLVRYKTNENNKIFKCKTVITPDELEVDVSVVSLVAILRVVRLLL